MQQTLLAGIKQLNVQLHVLDPNHLMSTFTNKPVRKICFIICFQLLQNHKNN